MNVVKMEKPKNIEEKTVPPEKFLELSVQELKAMLESRKKKDDSKVVTGVDFQKSYQILKNL